MRILPNTVGMGLLVGLRVGAAVPEPLLNIRYFAGLERRAAGATWLGGGRRSPFRWSGDCRSQAAAGSTAAAVAYFLPRTGAGATTGGIR